MASLDGAQHLTDKPDGKIAAAAPSLHDNLQSFADKGVIAGGASSASDTLPDLTINSPGQNQSNNSEQAGTTAFVRGFAESLAYSAVQSPLEGVAQLIDHTVGLPFQTHLAVGVKDAIVSAPAPASFGTAEWHGQSFGAAAGVLPWFALSRAGLRGGLSLLGLGEKLLPVAAADGLTIKAVVEGGATGAVASLLKPQDTDKDESFWAAKAGAGMRDFAAFATMTATQAVLSNKLGSLGIDSQITRRALNTASGALSGLPATFVDAGINLAQGRDQTLSDLGKSAYSYALIGGAFGAAARPVMADALDLSAHPEPVQEPQGDVLDLAPANDFNLHEGHVKSPKEISSKQISPKQIFPKQIGTDELSHAMPEIVDVEQAHWHLQNIVVGQLPRAFAATGLPEHQNLAHLDSLANALKNLDAGLPPQKKSGPGAVDMRMPTLDLKIGEARVEVSKIGIGEVAHVYKLSVDGQDFAFKIPNDRARADVHGATFETGAFVALSRHQVSDLIDFHAAHTNTDGGAGWMMTEYVDTPVKRAGKPLAEVLAKQGLVLGDDWSANRGPGNVVWDLGGIQPALDVRPKTLTELDQFLGTPQGKMIAGRSLSYLKDQTELKAALLLCLDQPSLEGQVARTAVRSLKDDGDINDVLNAALLTRGGAGRAAFELDRLQGTAYITDLFYHALNNPESRVEAAKHIDKLPTDKRLAAFEAAFVYPEARPMAARSVYAIAEGTDRTNAVNIIATDPGATYTYLQMLSLKQPLSDADQAQKSQALKDYLDRHGLKLATGAGTAASDRTSVDALNADQKKLDKSELEKMAVGLHLLTPEQWKTMGASDTRSFVNAAANLHLTQSDAQAMFKSPDFVKYLQGHKLNAHEAAEILKTWQSMPLNLKSLRGPELAEASQVFDRLSPLAWSRLDKRELPNVIDAIYSLNLSAQDSKQLVGQPEILQWYRVNGDAIDYLSPKTKPYTAAIMRNWDKLSPEEKAMPASQLIKKAVDADLAQKLGDKLGAGTFAYEYLTNWSTAAEKTSVMTGVSSFLESHENSVAMASDSQAFIAQLASKEAPANTFASELESKFKFYRMFKDDPAVEQTLFEAFKNPQVFQKAVNFLSLDVRLNGSLLDMALKEGTAPGALSWPDMNALSALHQKLALDLGDSRYLYQMMGAGLDLRGLKNYLDEYPHIESDVRKQIVGRAGAESLDLTQVWDRSFINVLKEGFSEDQQNALLALNKQGLKIEKVYNHLRSNWSEWDVLKNIMAAGAGVRELNNFFALSPYPLQARMHLLAAIDKGEISAPDLLAKTRDWQSGRRFLDLLSERAGTGEPLSKNELRALSEMASRQSAAAAKAVSGNGHAIADNSDANPQSVPPYEASLAETFKDAVRGIEAQIPADKPIVLLGRDAWPLLPLLRQAGRDTHYFMWSRLQHGDEATKTQWLKEVPPNAAVVDTGYSGSVIDQIRLIDPSASGYLLSSRRDDLYPTLLNFSDHSNRVASMEGFPKLVDRSSAHTSKGGTVSRPKVDNDSTEKVWSRWGIERISQDVLKASGLPTWDVWRYSNFVGLTPKERLGLRTNDEVERHYQNVAYLRRWSRIFPWR